MSLHKNNEKRIKTFRISFQNSGNEPVLQQPKEYLLTKKFLNFSKNTKFSFHLSYSPTLFPSTVVAFKIKGPHSQYCREQNGAGELSKSHFQRIGFIDWSSGSLELTTSKACLYLTWARAGPVLKLLLWGCLLKNICSQVF